MSSSSSTPPADGAAPRGRGAGSAGAPPGAPPGSSRGRPRPRTAVTWVLVVVWGLLMAFAAISILNPPWLAALSRPGIATEARGYVDAGDIAMRGGNFRAALGCYDQALRIDPEQVRARVNAAIAYGRLGQPGEGMRLLRAELERSPRQRGVILYQLGDLCRQTGDSSQAISLYRQALAAGAAPEIVQGRLGEAYVAAGDLESARDAFREALRVREDPAAGYRNMLLAARETVGEDSVQIRAIEEALARGVAEADLARYDLEFVRQEMSQDRELARTLGQLGAVEALLGEAAPARDHLSRALQIWPDQPQAKTYRSMLASL